MNSHIRNLALVLCLALTACVQATTIVTPTLKPTGALTPYSTSTSTPVPPTATQIVIIPVTPAPTPTPFLHTLTDTDTMLGLAFRYGITLEELKAANPGVNPNYLSVGKQLVIPIHGGTPQAIPTPTPVPVSLGKPACYPTGEGGAWCIVSVRNELSEDVENLSGWIGLFNTSGENFVSKVAYPPLNLLRKGESIPLIVYFPAPLPAKFDVQVRLLTGLTVSAGDTRYLDAQVDAQSVKPSADGKQSTVLGQVKLPAGMHASKVWVLVVAYDTTGEPIGIRKWESDGELSFNTTVYALAGVIDRVNILAEARP